jgi:hypothetical protein
MLLEMMEDKNDQRDARGSSAPDIHVRGHECGAHEHPG